MNDDAMMFICSSLSLKLYDVLLDRAGLLLFTTRYGLEAAWSKLARFGFQIYVYSSAWRLQRLRVHALSVEHGAKQLLLSALENLSSIGLK
jgi:hypothetical protein